MRLDENKHNYLGLDENKHNYLGQFYKTHF